MQPSPIQIIIRSNQTSQFQETTGLLYCIKEGEQVYYTAIVEKENISSSLLQQLNSGLSPLQLILQQQEKTRKKAEQIADKIIEEIILQKSRQSAKKEMSLQRRDNPYLQQDEINTNNIKTNNFNTNSQSNFISMNLQNYSNPQQNLGESRVVNEMVRVASSSSIDFNVKKSSQQLQAYQINNGITPQATNSYILKKNELIQKIGRQIERNIKEEQNNFPSSDNLSNSSRITPRVLLTPPPPINPPIQLTGYSPKLSELRILNKSRNLSASPQKSVLSITKFNSNAPNNYLNNPDERVETDISLISNANTVSNIQNPQLSILNLPQNQSGNIGQFDLKEFMKQAILQESNSLQIPKTPQNITEDTPAFNKYQQGEQQFPLKENNLHIHSLGNIDSLIQSKEVTPIAKRGKVRSPQSTKNAVNFHRPSQEFIPFMSPQLNYVKQHPNQRQQALSKSSSSKIGLTQRNVERDKLKKANAESETRSSLFKVASTPNYLKQSDDNYIQTYKTEASNNKIDGQQTSISDFILKVNSILQKSASINAQVEQSMQDSEKSMRQLNTLPIKQTS